MAIELVMPPNLILCHPLLLQPSPFPSIRVFSNESILWIKRPKHWRFSFSISPSKEYSGLISFRMDWLDLLAVQGTLKSLLQYHSSKASILWHSAFFIVQLSHPYMTTGKTIALIRWTFFGKVTSLLFNMLSIQSYQMLEEVVIGWQEVRWIWWMRQNFVAQFVQLLTHWLCNVWSGVGVEKNWAISVDQWWLQVLQFSVHLINLLSILLRCSGFAGIQKAVVDQTNSRPTNSDHGHFSVQVWFCEVLRRFSFLTFPICFKCWMIIEWSTLSSLATFCIIVRGGALMIALSWALSTSDGWPLSSSSSRLSISFAKLLEPELHCISVSSSSAKGVASHLYDPFWTGIKRSLKFTFGLASFL